MINLTKIAPYLGVASIVLGMVSIGIAILIYKKQKKTDLELAKTTAEVKSIASDTQVLTSGLDDSKARTSRISRFFGIDIGRDTKVRCVCPVESNMVEKPLPLVNGGDFHVVNVLSRLLDDRLIVKPSATEAQYSANGEDSRESTSDLTIHLCSPLANVELEKLLAVSDPEDDPPCGLPIWFSREVGSKHLRLRGQCGGWTTTRTTADQTYDARRENNMYVPREPVMDFGLIGRLNIAQQRIIILAGLHQYGTWIVGEALFRLIEYGSVGNSLDRLLNSDCQFLLVYSGQFDHIKFRVLDEISWMHGWHKQHDGDWSICPEIDVPGRRQRRRI